MSNVQDKAEAPIVIKNLLPNHFRDVQRMEKVIFIQEECTLPWAIPLLRPLKQRVKEFFKNYVQYILYQ